MAAKRVLMVFVAIAVLMMSVIVFAGLPEPVETVTAPNPGYWTPERMASAVPPNTALDESERVAPLNAASAGESVSVPGSAKSSLTSVFPSFDEEEAEALYVAGAAEPAPAADGYDTYPSPQNTYAIPKTWMGSYPYRVTGKVYFTLGSGSYVCSGSFISTHAVLTAGHCMYDPDTSTWATNWSIQPAHRPDWYAPFGTFYANKLRTNSSWTNYNDWCRDIGFACVSGTRSGYLGYAYNYSRLQHWTILGYPSTWGYTGHQMIQSDTSYASNDRPSSCQSGDPDAVAVGWGQAPGSSGGPWIRVFKPQQIGSMNYANGLNSYYYSGYPQTIHSPYFDTWVGNELSYVRSTYCP